MKKAKHNTLLQLFWGILSPLDHFEYVFKLRHSWSAQQSMLELPIVIHLFNYQQTLMFNMFKKQLEGQILGCFSCIRNFRPDPTVHPLVVENRKK